MPMNSIFTAWVLFNKRKDTANTSEQTRIISQDSLGKTEKGIKDETVKTNIDMLPQKVWQDMKRKPFSPTKTGLLFHDW